LGFSIKLGRVGGFNLREKDREYLKVEEDRRVQQMDRRRNQIPQNSLGVPWEILDLLYPRQESD
jgi:vacuolar-type H+-ATPase subunit B/Vma2